MGAGKNKDRYINVAVSGDLKQRITDRSKKSGRTVPKEGAYLVNLALDILDRQDQPAEVAVGE